MKKIINSALIILFAILMFFSGCSNSAQITFEDESKPKYTEDGFSTLCVKIGTTPDYRTIFPEDWTEEKKGSLFYNLTGKAKDGNGTQSEKVNFEGSSKGTKFTYEELKSGRAVITLDPIHWDLTLTAYQGKEDNLETVIDYTKPVLSANIPDVDLTNGETTITFNLITYVPSKKEGVDYSDGKGPVSKADSDNQATGELDVCVRFHLDEVEKALIKRVTLDVVEVTVDPDSGLKTEKSQLVGPDGALLNKALETKKAEFGEESDQWYTAQLTNQSHSKPGNYQLKITFYDQDTDGKIVLQHIENVKIDGGNLTKTLITIPEGSFNKPPLAPSNLSYNTYFTPASNKLVISEAKKIYAQQVVNISESNGEDILKDDPIGTQGKTNISDKLKAATQENRYNLELNWIDNSYNESGFKVHLTTTAPSNNKIEIAWNDVEKKHEIKYGDNYGSTDEPAGTNTGIKIIDADPMKLFESGLQPSSETLTISLPMETYCKDISVIAYNFLGEAESTPIANSVEIPEVPDVSQKIPAQDPIGMFTVAYKLADANRETGNNHLAIVNYAPSLKTSLTYFVMAYNYNSKENLIGQSNLVYPYIENPLYYFEGWVYDDPDDGDKAVTVNKLSDFISKNAVDPVVPGAVNGDNSHNKNIEVYASWTTPLTVKITFPSYSEYKELRSATNQNPYNTIEPEIDSKGNKKVVFTLPTVAKSVAEITNMKFVIYAPYKDGEAIYDLGAKPDPKTLESVKEEEGKDLVKPEPENVLTGGKSLTWDISKFLEAPEQHGDVYRLNISYDYAKRKVGAAGYDTSNDYETPVTIDGNFFVKISK